MRYYIINPSEGKAGNCDYKIIKVKQADEANFLEDYGSRIIARGDSMVEALLKFEQWKNEQQVS